MRYIPIELTDETIAELQDPSIEASDLDFAVVHVDQGVRASAARNPAITPQHIQWLSHDRNEVQSALAENPVLDSATLVTLSQSPHIRVRSNAISHPNFPAASLASFAKDSSLRIRAAVAASPSATIDLLTSLASDQEFSVRAHVSRHPNTPAAVLDRLSTDSFKEVIEGVAENPNTPLTVLERYLYGPHDEKFHSVKNPSLTDEILLKALEKAMELTEEQDESWEDGRGDTNLRQWIAERNPISEKIILTLIEDPYLYVRASLARNEGVPDSFLAKLAFDKEEAVRTAVVANSNASADTKAAAVLLGVEEN